MVESNAMLVTVVATRWQTLLKNIAVVAMIFFFFL